MQSQIAQSLENARRELLELSTRNRLIHTPLDSSRPSFLRIVGEDSSCLFDILVRDRKSMSFLPKPDSAFKNSASGAKKFDDTILDETSERQEFVQSFDASDPRTDTLAELEWIGSLSNNPDALTDLNLQTNLDSESLQKRLLKHFYDARSFEEEQGVSILYLACGFLKWIEKEGSKKERFAPLLLLPVELSRTKAGSKFQLRYREDDIVTNLSIQARLSEDFSIRLPDLPESCSDDDEFNPSSYFQSVQNLIQDRSGWQVISNEIVLWFFSFSKFLMFKDLQADAWPEHAKIDSHPLVSSILGNGFREQSAVNFEFAEDEVLDDRLNPADVIHVTDADSSQAVVIDEVAKGRNLVVQGPPGTGKSQTITNIVAAAVHSGKRVLFVSEKMAALEVVKRRLDQVGLGDMILELHSNKARKQEVLANLKQTLSLGQPNSKQNAPAEALREISRKLREHDQALHRSIGKCETSPYQAMGHLLRLRQSGMKTASYSYPQMKAWDGQVVNDLLNVCGELQQLMAQSGPTQKNPWHGVKCQPMTPAELYRLQVLLSKVAQQAAELADAYRRLATHLGIPDAGSVLAVSECAQLAMHLIRCPEHADRSCLKSQAWQKQADHIEGMLSLIRRLQSLKAELLEETIDLALTEPWESERRAIASRGQSWFRWLSKEYRNAIAKLRSVLKANVNLPKGFDDRLALIDKLRQFQSYRQQVESISPLAAELLGNLWKASETEVAAAEQVVKWIKDCQKSKFLKQHATTKACEDLNKRELQLAVEPIGKLLKQVDAQLTEIVNLLKLDLPTTFKAESARAVRLVDWIARIQSWIAQPEQLSHYLATSVRLKKLQSVGLDSFVTELESGYIEHDKIIDRFNLVRYESLLSEAWQTRPGLSEFHGTAYEGIRSQFVDLDLQRIVASRLEVAKKHFAGMPNQTADAGQVGVLKREMNRKRRHMPLRKLMNAAGQAIQKIKPVFMMSPLSIANYLPPGSVEFDLLVIDEASQVQPVDALGAIARCKQIVVVGDQRQLPPTNFFGRVSGTTDSDEDTNEAANAGDMESILGLCEAQGIPNRMLRWHYRSKHESLIAVSNRQFYENRLFIVPSPIASGDSLGLKLRYISDGCYDRGGTRTNRKEAAAVAHAVMDHFRISPDLSLGVATFSSAQRDAILDELELLRQADPSLEECFGSGGLSPFFVKSIENVQGDERDVIFISVGYGRDASGVFYQSFGPLNSKGGERRLNVLISRASRQCVVFSSIRSCDIDLNRTQAEGVVALKLYLNYAESGKLEANQSLGESDSVFDDQVAIALRNRGFQVDHQIGVAGFFIDLAVRDPGNPGRYLLGIECDGAQFHSARWVRDRDRLRQQILESRGWIIHRVWSTDWFQRPEEQLECVIAAIQKARDSWQQNDERLRAPGSEKTCSTVSENSEPYEWSRETSTEGVPDDQEQSLGYEEASFTVPASGTVQQMAHDKLAAILQQIVSIESPIHEEELCRRTLSILGNGRLVASARNKILAIVEVLAGQKLVERRDEFVYSKTQTIFPPRSREGANSANLRKASFIAPEEIREAIQHIVRDSIGADSKDTFASVSKLLGIPNSALNQDAIAKQIEGLISLDKIADRSGKLFVQNR